MLGIFVKTLMKSRLTALASLDRAISREEIERSSKCLLAVFSRYGDAIASFKVLNEFIAMYPEKSFIAAISRFELSQNGAKLMTAEIPA